MIYLRISLTRRSSHYLLYYTLPAFINQCDFKFCITSKINPFYNSVDPYISYRKATLIYYFCEPFLLVIHDMDSLSRSLSYDRLQHIVHSILACRVLLRIRAFGRRGDRLTDVVDNIVSVAVGLLDDKSDL